MSELPEGWVEASLGELVRNLDSRRVPVNAKERARRPGDVPYYGAAGQVGTIDSALFDEELLLVGEDGVQFFDADKRKAYRIRGPAWVNNHAHVLAERLGVSLDYLSYFLNQFDYHGYANGTTRLKLTRSALDSIPVALAASREQRRVVEAIAEAFSKLDAGEQAMKAVRQRLARLRDALVVAAMEGRLERLGSVGGWRRARLGSVLAEPLANGRSVRTRDGGFPVLRLTCLRSGRIDLRERKGGDWSAAEAGAFLVRSGDFLVSRGNGSLSLVGRGGLVVDEPDSVAYPDTLIRVRATPSILAARLLAIWWNSPFVRQQLEARARTTSGLYKVNQEMIADVTLPIPPIEQQEPLAAEVERQFSFIEACERAVNEGLARAAALRRSVLKCAFEGKLVPQDPSDEPASVLLERIRAERAAEPKKVRKR